MIASLRNSLQGCGKIKGARATASSIYGSLMCLPQQSFFHKHNHCTTSTQVRDIHPQPTLLYSLLHLPPFSNPKSSDNRASVFSSLLVRRHRLAVVTAKVRIAEIGQHPKFRPQECFSEKHFAKDHCLYLHQNSLVKVVLSFGYVFDIVMLSKNV